MFPLLVDDVEDVSIVSGSVMPNPIFVFSTLQLKLPWTAIVVGQDPSVEDPFGWEQVVD